MSQDVAVAEGTELGRGRSGAVYLARDEDGAELARKVFDSHSVTKLVQWILLAAPNPYMWSEDAARCAVLRRRILQSLVPCWFDGKLAVAGARDHLWNEEARAYELRTEFSPGRPPWLHHPLRMDYGDEAKDLLEILRPLQEELIESGFDGLAWQAGKGNPVALNNFLFERFDPKKPKEGRWVWIDLESGVPALIPINPLALLGFYLPRSFLHGGPLFDDVDCVRLQSYLREQVTEIVARAGEERHAELLREVEELAERQLRWKTQPRHERAIDYRLSRGDIDRAEAERYRGRPLRWYARESVRGAGKAVRLVARLPGKAIAWLRTVDFLGIAAGAVKFFVSQRFRYLLSRSLVAGRIDAWQERDQMTPASADHFRERLEEQESSSYITDFGVHLAVKPFVKGLQWWVLPALVAAGVIGGGTFVFLVAAGGAIVRTAYTGSRLIQSALAGREKPWLALVVGVFPVVGNFAYPLQILYSSAGEDDDLALFILHDGFARIGQHAPIWGGADTLTEHFMNRIPDRLWHLRKVLHGRKDADA